MMIAIYRANPAAFRSNLNALRSRAVLRIPSAEELAAISPPDAEHEYRDQLAAWRGSDARKLRTRADVIGSAETDRLALTRRVESLEQSLQAVRRELQERTQEIQVRAAPPPAPTPAPIAKDIEPRHNGGRLPWYRRPSFIAPVSGIALMLAAGLWWAFRRRNEDDPGVILPAAPSSSLTEEAQIDLPVQIPSAELPTHAPAAQEAFTSGDGIQVQEDARVVSPPTDSVATAPPPEPAAQIDTGATTAILGPELEAAGDTVEHRFSFYNPESHADTTHVVMGSELTQPLAFVERRRNPAIVLQQAIEREPWRSDLHLKLLELYYAMASENRLAFLEATRQIMQKKSLLSDEDWARIADMGRRIAPDDELFANKLDDQAVA